jgi:Family of unknown function (DUF5953)
MIDSLTFFVPPDEGDWIDRMDSACQVLERIFGVELRKAHSGAKNNATALDIVDRLRFFKGRLKTKNRWFALYSGDGLTRVGTGLINQSYFCVGGRMYADGDSYVVSVMYPEQTPARHEEVLVAAGDALRARSSQYTPAAVARRLRQVHWHPLSARGQLTDKTDEEERLPLIRESLYMGLGTLQPHHFGWLNYWSQEVSAYVGLPERAERTSMLEHSYRTPGGAWLVKLGADPFEARNADHGRLLCAAYETFPRVGNRAIPPETRQSTADRV